MKKVLICLLLSGLMLSALTGCRNMSNVSDASDGSVTSGHEDSVIESLSEILSEMNPAGEESVSESAGRSSHFRTDTPS